MSKKIPYPAIRVNKRWSKYLQNLDCPSAGPYPNITGMRNLYWGKDAPIILCSVYAYKVPLDIYTRFKY